MPMEVILLERNSNLGNLGDKVSVKNGHARNFLIPQKKAVVANAKNLQDFEQRRAEFEKQSAEKLQEAQARADQVNGKVFVIAAKAGEEGKLFGSIGTREIAEAVSKEGIQIEKSAVRLPAGPVRYAGEYDISVQFHADVTAVVKIKIDAEA
jgi:large subunit ribosomal protein L9